MWTGGITPEGRVQIWCSAFLHICRTIVLGKLNPKMHISCLAVEKDRPPDSRQLSLQATHPEYLKQDCQIFQALRFCPYGRLCFNFHSPHEYRPGPRRPLKIGDLNAHVSHKDCAGASNEAYRYNFQGRYAPHRCPHPSDLTLRGNIKVNHKHGSYERLYEASLSQYRYGSFRNVCFVLIQAPAPPVFVKFIRRVLTATTTTTERIACWELHATL